MMAHPTDGDDFTRARQPTPLPQLDATPEADASARYRLLDRLGVGGMGEVYRAEDAILGRIVALKLILENTAGFEDVRERFLREARIAAGLRSDHIVPVHDFGTLDGRLFLTMPLLEGETLEDRLAREGALSPREVVRIGLQAARGLGKAHEAGVVHRDIKPSNIFLEGDEGKVVLLDFGIAKSVSDDRLTQTGVAVGTYRFMSPEQLSGRADLDHRSDLFSLGSVLYQAAVGRLPFDGEMPFDIMRAIREENPRPPKSLKGSTPTSLSELIMRLLAKDPAGRTPPRRWLRRSGRSPVHPAAGASPPKLERGHRTAA